MLGSRKRNRARRDVLLIRQGEYGGLPPDRYEIHLAPTVHRRGRELRLHCSSDGRGAAKRVDYLVNGFHAAAVTIYVMFVQAVITKSVIDGGLRFPQFAPVLTHEEIRSELIRQIDAGKVKQVDVARKLAIAPARVAEMRKLERRVQQDEMPVLATLLGLSDERPKKERPVEETARIPHWGKVAQGLWLEQSFHSPDPDDLEFVPYDRVRGDPEATDLFAVTPEGTSMKDRFPLGTNLICRRIPFGTGSIAPGDYVIVEREAHDLREMTCKRVEMDDDGVYWLHSETDDDRFKEPWRIGRPNNGLFTDNEVRVIGKVIRAVQDYERGRH